MGKRFLLMETNKGKTNFIASIEQEPAQVYNSRELIKKMSIQVKLINDLGVNKVVDNYKLDFVLLDEDKIYEVRCNKIVHGEEFNEFKTLDEAYRWFYNKACLLRAEAQKSNRQKQAMSDYIADQRKKSKR